MHLRQAKELRCALERLLPPRLVDCLFGVVVVDAAAPKTSITKANKIVKNRISTCAEEC